MKTACHRKRCSWQLCSQRSRASLATLRVVQWLTLGSPLPFFLSVSRTCRLKFDSLVLVQFANNFADACILPRFTQEFKRTDSDQYTNFSHPRIRRLYVKAAKFGKHVE